MTNPQRAIIRPAELEDVPEMCNLAVECFGQPSNTGIDWLINTALQKSVEECLVSRIRVSQATSRADHNVLCLVDDVYNSSHAPRGICGIVEVSLQPRGRRSTKLPIALEAKRQRYGETLRPYVSNLLVAKRYRRQGFAQRLVKECESIAVAWGFREICLHVDKEERSALSLYQKLGYFTVSEDPAWKKIIEGVQLRFMQRDLYSRR